MLSPLDLQSKKVDPKRKKYYDKAQMDDYLDLVNENYKNLYTENEELKKENRELGKKIKTLSDGIQYYRSIESTMQKALVLAEKTSTETKDAAMMKAEAIEKDANTRAEQIISEAEQEYERIREKCMTLVQEFNQYRAELKQVATNQLKLVTSKTFEVDTPELDEDFVHVRQENSAAGKHAPLQNDAASDMREPDIVQQEPPQQASHIPASGPPAGDVAETGTDSGLGGETVILPDIKKDIGGARNRMPADDEDTMSILTADTIDLRDSIQQVQMQEESVPRKDDRPKPSKEKKRSKKAKDSDLVFVQEATVKEPVDARPLEPMDARLNQAHADDLEILEPPKSKKEDAPTLDSLLQSMNMGGKKKNPKGQEDDPFEFLGSVDDF